MSELYRSKTIRKTPSPDTLISIDVVDDKEEIIDFVNNHQNIKYQVKVDVKLQNIK